MVIIEVESPIYSKVVKGKELIKDIFSFDSIYYQKSQYRNVRKEYKKCLIKGRLIYTGWIDRIIEFCQKKDIDFEIIQSKEYLQCMNSIEIDRIYDIPGIIPREDQTRLVEACLENRRGIIVAPTGTGKTIIAMLLMKAFHKHRILFLCPSISIVDQTIDELQKFKFEGISRVGGGDKDLSGKIVISTIQSFRNFNLDEICFDFDVVIADEVHLAMDAGSSYEKIMSKLFAPIRIGLTATPPNTKEKELIFTGLFGEIIERVTLEESQEIGMLTPLRIEFINVPFSKKLYDLNIFKDFYRYGIVENRTRNRLIAIKAKELTKENCTVLIFVTRIDHGDLILNELENIGVESIFVRGSTEGELRKEIKTNFENKEIKCIVASVWKEGINIPSLGAIILAGGGKSEISLIQSIGRSLRKSEGKEEALIIDFLDPGKYLAEHTVERIQIYNELGFI